VRSDAEALARNSLRCLEIHAKRGNVRSAGPDSKSPATRVVCGFESRPGYGVNALRTLRGRELVVPIESRPGYYLGAPIFQNAIPLACWPTSTVPAFASALRS